jgi:hypothetical protein
MRYPDGQTPDDIGSAVSPEMLAGSAIYGLVVAIGMILMGLRARQLWLAFWGAVVLIGSLAYLIARALGYE